MRNEIANFKDCKSIAIMGGTFDPIHNGHLVTAEAVRHRFKVDRVVFIPTGRPAHKLNKKVTHNEHRYLMTVLATMRNENFEVSRIEIDRPGATYTIDTIEELKKICSDYKVKIGIITVPAEAAQKMCDMLVDCGVKAIWNFAPCKLELPEGVLLQQENLELSLAYLNEQLRISQKNSEEL
jgi:nicotinate-nucleotide adenylyltransferase